MPWELLAILGAGTALYVVQVWSRRAQRDAAADASGLAPVRDLSHLPEALQRTALWSLSDGGFERRVLHGAITRGDTQIAVTAFDLETLRERRGEWAYLPVEPPFRIGGVVSVVVCEIDRSFPHALIKRVGRGDQMADDDRLERLGSLTKQMRGALGVERSHPAELPPTLPIQVCDVGLPEGWRGYSREPDRLAALVAGGLRSALDRAARRDLVIELLDTLVILYPAARDVPGPDALADLTTLALAVVDGVRGATVTPRGVTPSP